MQIIEIVIDNRYKIFNADDDAGIFVTHLDTNPVRTDEYILMTRPFHDLSGDLEGMPPELGQEQTDLGPVDVVVFYPDPDDRPLPKATWSGRLKQFTRIEAKGARRMLRGHGAREFTNLPSD